MFRELVGLFDERATHHDPADQHHREQYDSRVHDRIGGPLVIVGVVIVIVRVVIDDRGTRGRRNLRPHALGW